MNWKTYLRNVFLFGMVSLLASCGGGSGSGSKTGELAVLKSIAVTPSPLTINKGNSAILTATGTDSNGIATDITSKVTWEIVPASGVAVATVDTAGKVTGATVGSAGIIAKFSGVDSKTAPITVTDAELKSIAITPASASIYYQGGTQAYTAIGTYSDGTTNDISGSVTWNSSNTAAATIIASGVATGKSINTTTITATLNGIPSNNATLDVAHYSAVGVGCVKDNSTGLTWEVKSTGGGLRDMSNTYTNYDDPNQPQTWNGAAYVNPTQAEINASTNTLGYVAAVNANKLCGHNDWRMPTSSELQGIMLGGTTPTIDATWFPNTEANFYWTSSPYVGVANVAWVVNFYLGRDDYFNRSGTYCVRLVR